MQIVKLDSVESTNKYCEVLDLAKVEDFTCYWALEQTSGIGQRGNVWHSTPRQNLTFSLILHPTFLHASRQFLLTQALSLALCDFISPLTYHLSPFTSHLSPSIKWPNDIYVDGKKICGTLITSHLSPLTYNLSTCICGIGLNVNQTDFPDWLPNPTSLKLLTGETYDLEKTLCNLLQCIEHRYNALSNGADIQDEYLSHLLWLGEQRHYTYLGTLVDATITGVDPFGRLLLTTADDRQLICNLKEIS